MWTRGDRLRKARNLTGLTTREFAERVGVSQKTITDAENDKRDSVRKILMNAWALATGVPVDWLEHGTSPGPDGGPVTGPYLVATAA
jgi:transcriptional regulator with XRE-family HTH domain